MIWKQIRMCNLLFAKENMGNISFEKDRVHGPDNKGLIFYF
jgi:hypothetical protein